MTNERNIKRGHRKKLGSTTKLGNQKRETHIRNTNSSEKGEKPPNKLQKQPKKVTEGESS